MTAVVIVRCDSNPAPYSGTESPMPCRGWLVTRHTVPERARAEAARAGWSWELTYDSTTRAVVEVDTCPACVRARAHLDARAPA